MVDYSFHQIITDASDDVIFNEIPAVVASGIRSLKVFLTYDPLHLDDRGYLRVLAAIRRGEVVMRDDVVQAASGSGRFLARGPYDMSRPRGVLPDGFNASAHA